MRRIMLLALAFLSSHMAGHAQPQAYESKIDYQKTQHAAAAIDLPYSTDLVEDAIKDYMAKKGIKGSGLKGFTVYHGVKLDDTTAALKDLYFKVDRRNRDKNASTVTMLVAMPSEDPATHTAGDSLPLDGPRAFLNNLVPSVEAANLDMQIKGQEAVSKKSEKKYNDLKDDQSDYEKKIRDAQSDLVQNKKDQTLQAAAVQTNVNGDQDALKKAQKKLNKLLDQQASLEKKIRNWQTALDQNKNDQVPGQADVLKQQQILDSLKVRQKS